MESSAANSITLSSTMGFSCPSGEEKRESGSSVSAAKLSGRVVVGRESANAVGRPRESGGSGSNPSAGASLFRLSGSDKGGSEARVVSGREAGVSLRVSEGKTTGVVETEGRRIVHPPPKIRKKSSKKAVILLLHTKCSVLILRWHTLLS
ncbi:Uncharacterised protein [Chlamydia trachomatis]|nr:Uncharacterised protein [Chlamydia trachomatis]